MFRDNNSFTNVGLMLAIVLIVMIGAMFFYKSGSFSKKEEIYKNLGISHPYVQEHITNKDASKEFMEWYFETINGPKETVDLSPVGYEATTAGASK